MWTELAELCEECGLSEPLLVESSPLEIKTELSELMGTCQFVSATYRIFKPAVKLAGTKHKLSYLGNIAESGKVLAAVFSLKSSMLIDSWSTNPNDVFCSAKYVTLTDSIWVLLKLKQMRVTDPNPNLRGYWSL